MSVLYISHSAFLNHQGAPDHPERPDRLRAIEKAIGSQDNLKFVREEAPLAYIEQIARVHPISHINYVRHAEPEIGTADVDADTYLSVGSFEATRRACGAVICGVDKVLSGEVSRVFCAVRPPGHHAEKSRAMGFCLCNAIAVGAMHARVAGDLERIAIVDFDVHHGNGTQEIFWQDKAVLYASTHQMPLYPGTGSASETGVGNIFNVPLRPGDGSAEFRIAMSDIILPAIDRFEPDLIMVSAGFDAHLRDPLGQLELLDGDFSWITERLCALANAHCHGRLVSVLEGGYDLTGLARSVVAHLNSLAVG